MHALSRHIAKIFGVEAYSRVGKEKDRGRISYITEGLAWMDDDNVL